MKDGVQRAAMWIVTGAGQRMADTSTKTDTRMPLGSPRNPGAHALMKGGAQVRTAIPSGDLIAWFPD